MKESSIRSSILKWLNSLPESYFEVSPPGSPTAKPDITGCKFDYRHRCGRYVAIEVKIPGKNPRRAQVYAMDKLEEAGAVCIVATSLQEVKLHMAEEFGSVVRGIGPRRR